MKNWFVWNIYCIIKKKKKICIFYWFLVKYVEFSGKERVNVLRNRKIGSWIGDFVKMVKLKIFSNV